MAHLGRRCSIGFIGLMLVSQTISAQRLHDTRKAQLAHDAAKNFDDLASKNDGLYELALKNVDVVHAADLAMLRQRNKATLDAELELLPTLTWKDVMDRVAKKRQELLTHLPTPGAAAGSSAAEKQAALAQAIKKLQDQIATEDAASETALPTVKEIHAFVTSAIQTGQVSGADLAALKAKAEQLPNLFEQLKKIEKGLLQMPSGLQPVILEGQLKEAQVELERIALQQQHDKDVEDTLKSQLQLVTELAGASTTAIDCHSQEDIGVFRFFRHYLCVEDHKPLCAKPSDPSIVANQFDATPDEMVVVSVGRLAKQANSLTSCGVETTQALKQLLDLLSLYGSIVGVRTYMVEASDLDVTNGELQFQIRLAELNAREHELLIASALKGLDLFEQGGIKSEDVANLIRAAQAAATAVIAGRVD